MKDELRRKSYGLIPIVALPLVRYFGQIDPIIVLFKWGESWIDARWHLVILTAIAVVWLISVITGQSQKQDRVINGLLISETVLLTLFTEFGYVNFRIQLFGSTWVF